MQPASIVNLSSYPLKDSEVKILSKGLKFIPKPQKVVKEDVQQAVADFNRRIRLVDFFDSINTKHKEQKPFYEKSKWTPPGKLNRPEILTILNDIDTKVDSIKLTQGDSNITKAELKALKNLQNNSNIIIKPADKGSSTVIMDKSDYLHEGYTQLSNNRYYKKIQEPIHPNVRAEINGILSDLRSNGFIDKKQLEYLQVPQ